MKIIDNTGTRTSFSKLSVGQCFKDVIIGEFYIKCNSTHDKNRVEYNCVNLTRNEIEYKCDDMQVIPASGRLIIEE